MDLLRESRYIMHLFIIILLCWLGWLCGVAFGQVDEAFTGSANFPDIGLTCIGNLAALIKFILGGKRWCNYRSKLILSSRKSEKLKNINGLEVLTCTSSGELGDCSVVIFSFQMPITRSMRLLVRYISNVYDVHSIFLQCFPLQSVPMCTDVCTENDEGRCKCIVFKTVEDITMMLARRMPGTVKRLSESLCLLPSLSCLKNGCHGCNQGLLHVENERLREGVPQLEPPAAVCELLDLESTHTTRSCICIPVRSANEDDWTRELITLFEPDDNEFRGAVIRKGRTSVSSALENYKNGIGDCYAEEKYKLASLVILPKLITLLINIVLTFWFKVDGLSSHMLARKAVQDFLSVKFPSP